MKSSTETGHAKNVATFETLISFCTGYGTAYNPTKTTLTIANLKSLHTSALTTLQQVKTNKTAFDNATNQRQLAFKDLKPFATKLVNALAVSDANKLVLANAKTINRKIQGTPASKANKIKVENVLPNATENTVKTISTSQQSYDSMIDHFTKLIETISQETTYAPNETELKIVNLQAKLDVLKTTNTSQINANTAWSNARIERDNLLYNVTTGLVQIALDVKRYVKSVFGATSPQIKQINSLVFIASKEN
jgi:hypothetical protein